MGWGGGIRTSSCAIVLFESTYTLTIRFNKIFELTFFSTSHDSVDLIDWFPRVMSEEDIKMNCSLIWDPLEYNIQ